MREYNFFKLKRVNMEKADVKSRWRNKYFFIPLILLAVLVASCKDDGVKKVVFDPGLPVKVESFSPDTGGAGTQMVIIGENFGTDKNLIKVFVGKKRKEAAVVGADGNHIYAVVAARTDTGKVYVQVGMEAKIRQDSSKMEFNYQIQENVSTYSGTNERKTLDGPRFSSGDDAACFDFPHYMTIDKEGIIYVLEGEQESGNDNQGLRIIQNDEVISGFRRKNKNRQGRFRSIAFSLSQDTLFVGHDDGDANKAAFFISTRANNFQDLTEVVTGTVQCNAVAVNPVTGELFFNNFGRGKTFRYNFQSEEAEPIGTDLGENKELYFCWSLQGDKLFAVVRNGSYIAVAHYDLTARTLGPWEPIIGKMHDDDMGADADYKDGIGRNAWLHEPCQMVAGPDGDYFLADRGNHIIRRIVEVSSGTYQVSTYAGQPKKEGYTDGKPLKSQFKSPSGLTVDEYGTIYVADRDNNRIRKIVVE